MTAELAGLGKPEWLPLGGGVVSHEETDLSVGAPGSRFGPD